jgi:hypothetical protein
MMVMRDEALETVYEDKKDFLDDKFDKLTDDLPNYQNININVFKIIQITKCTMIN